MKRTILLLVVLAALFTFMVMNVRADDCPTLEDMLNERYQAFATAVEEASAKMRIRSPLVRKLDSMTIEGANGISQVSGWDGMDPTTKMPTGEYGVDICQSFLVNPIIVLQHVAAHEVCHFHLRAMNNPDVPWTSELEAERCVFEYEGEDRFFEVYKIVYAQHGKQLHNLDAIKAHLGIR